MGFSPFSPTVADLAAAVVAAHCWWSHFFVLLAHLRNSGRSMVVFKLSVCGMLRRWDKKDTVMVVKVLSLLSRESETSGTYAKYWWSS